MGFTFMVDHFFHDDNLSIPATYYPAGGEPSSPVRVIFRQPDEMFNLGGFEVQARVYTFDLRVSDVAAPKVGDRILVNGTLYELHATPRSDPLHVVWSCGVRLV